MQFFSKRVHLGDTYYTFFITFARNILFDTSRTQHYKDLIHCIHMKNVLLLVSTILLFVCCTSSKERKTLQQAESVVYTTPDSANKLFKQVSFSNLRSEKDKAYYALLKSIIAYRLYERQPLRDINYALSYYKQHSDYRYLQMAYFYHGAVNDENGGDIIVSMRDFKEAEMLISKTCNKVLESYIYSALIGIFFSHNVNNLGLEYSNKSIALAKAMNDEETLSGAYGNKAIFDERMNKINRAWLNYKLSLKYIDSVKYVVDKAYTYQNIAFFFDNRSEENKAKKYFSLAAQCNPNDSYIVLWNKMYASINFIQAQQIAQKLYSTNNFVQRNLYTILARKAQQERKYQISCKYANMADSIKDLIESDPNQAHIRKIQEEYLLKSTNNSRQSTCLFLLITITFLAIFTFIAITYIRKHYERKNASLQQEIDKQLHKVNILSSSLSMFKEKSEEHSNIIAIQEESLRLVREEIETLKKQSKKQRTESKKLLEQMINGIDITIRLLQGGKLKLLDKKDRLDFIFLHSKTISTFNDDFISSTTPQEQIFYILVHLGFNREKIQQVLCISDESFRKVKSRLPHKLKSHTELIEICDNLMVL